MNRSCICIALAALAGFAVPGEAQQRPDFAGEWILADTADRRPAVAAQGDAAFRVGAMGSGWGSPLTILQQPNRLTVQYVYFSAYDLQPPVRFIYALDGSESRNSVMIGHASSEQRSRAAWQGDTLRITTLHRVPDAAGRASLEAEVRQALSLEATGRLVVLTTRVGIPGAETTTTRSVYARRG